MFFWLITLPDWYTFFFLWPIRLICHNKDGHRWKIMTKYLQALQFEAVDLKKKLLHLFQCAISLQQVGDHDSPQLFYSLWSIEIIFIIILSLRFHVLPSIYTFSLDRLLDVSFCSHSHLLSMSVYLTMLYSLYVIKISTVSPWF